MYLTEDLTLLRNRFALPPSIDNPVQVRINAVPNQGFGTRTLAFE